MERKEIERRRRQRAQEFFKKQIFQEPKATQTSFLRHFF